MTTFAPSPPRCDGHSTGRVASDWGMTSLRCEARRGLASWLDAEGTLRYACPAPGHRREVERRFGVGYVSEIADDPLGQAKAEYQRVYERSGVDPHGIYGPAACSMPGHVPGCSGKAGGDHELLPEWIAIHGEGYDVEIEMAD